MRLRSTAGHRFAAVLATLAATVVVAASAVPATADTIAKRGVDVATGSSTQVAQGGTADWTIGYRNTGTTETTAVINDPVGANQTYVAGSLRVPSGWTGSFSTDGATFTSTEPGDPATVAAVRAVGRVPSPATGSLKDMPAPTAAVDQSSPTDGDGFVPILVGGRVYNIFHRRPASDFDINCFDPATNARCAGYPKQFLGGSVSTSMQPDAVVEGTKIFYPAQRASDNGVGCFDTATGTDCGYTQTGTLARVGGAANPNAFDGMTRVGNRLFTLGNDLRWYCADISDPNAPVPCAGQPYAPYAALLTYPVLEAWNPAVHDNSGILYGATAIGTRIYAVINFQTGSFGFPFGQGNLGAKLVCLDTTTGGDCGFAPQLIPNSVTAFAGGWVSVFPLRDASLNPTGFCVYGNANLLANTALQTNCFSSSGASVAAPANWLNALPVQQLPLKPLEFEGRMYVPYGAAAVSNLLTSIGLGASAPVPDGHGFCYDWAAQAPCAGFGTAGVANWPNVAGNQAKTYGFAADSRCMWGLGDAGVLYSFDAATGTAPCRRVQTSLTVKPETEFYCDSQPHPFTWNELTVTNTALSAFTSIVVSARDKLGNVVVGPTNVVAPGYPTPGRINVSSVPATGASSELSFDVVATAASTAPWTPTSAPTVNATFTGDDPQICWQSRIADSCAVTSVTNVATLLSTTPSPSATATLNVTRDPQRCESTTSTGSTTTVPPTSSTVPPTSSTVAPTSSTVAPNTTVPSTTTTVPPSTSVSPNTIVVPDPPTPSDPPALTVAAGTQSRGGLPSTGGTNRLGGIGIALVLGGLALLLVARGRRIAPR